MIFLKCKLCKGEIDIIDDLYSLKIKCLDCGYSSQTQEFKKPEIIIIKKRTQG